MVCMCSEKTESNLSTVKETQGLKVLEGKESCNSGTCVTHLRMFLQIDGKPGET